jgi:hypothetical protein
MHAQSNLLRGLYLVSKLACHFCHCVADGLPSRFNYYCHFFIEHPPAEGAENGLDFTIVRPFNWIGPRMDFIPGVDGPSEGVPRVLACFSNVSVLVSW